MVTNFTGNVANGFLVNLVDKNIKGFEGAELNGSFSNLNRVYLAQKFSDVLYHTATDLIKNEQLIVTKVDYQNEELTLTLKNNDSISIKL